jgi:uncharacterized protein (TIGR03067 family)
MRSLAMFALTLAVAVPDRPAPVQPRPDDAALLNGTWAVVSYEFDGGRLPEDQVAAYPKLIIKNGTYRWTSTEVAASMTIHPTKSPKEVDYMMQGQLYLGIYELRGDIFRDCISPPGRPRALDFTVPPGSGRMYFVYRRVKN